MRDYSKTRVLIVDDEPVALAWLERSLAGMRDRWDMTFTSHGTRALELMDQSDYQVVVSDMRMPGMSGAELLGRVKERFPNTIRLVIADYADRGSVVECVGSAHQFLSKPCHPEELRGAIDRACYFKNSVRSDRIKSIIAQMEPLPSIPSILNELLAAIRREGASLEEVGKIIGQDLAMTAKLLQLVNSGFFGLQSEVTNPAEAVAYLGLDTVRALLLTTQAFSAFGQEQVGPIKLDTLWRHSLQVADMARRIAQDAGAEPAIVEESFIAGMLHDIGKLALAAKLPGQYRKVTTAGETLGLSLHAAEEAAFGAHHGDIGGYMLRLWGLAPRAVNAITCHHEPDRDDAPGFTTTTAVHVANALAHETSVPPVDCLDVRYIERIEMAAFVPHWREITRRAEKPA